MHAVAVEVGKHLGQVGKEVVGGCLLQVEGHGLAFFLLLHGGENLGEGHIVVFGVHGDVAQRDDFLVAVGGETLLVAQGFHDQHVLATGYELIQTGFAGNG